MSIDKSSTAHIDDASITTPSNTTQHQQRDWTAEEENLVKYTNLNYPSFHRLNPPRRKADHRVFPMLCILFSLSLLDRTNISGAYIAGLGRDLQLNVGSRYNLALLIFYVRAFIC